MKKKYNMPLILNRFINKHSEKLLKLLCESDDPKRIKYIQYLLEAGVSPKNTDLLKIVMPGFKIYNRNRNIRSFRKNNYKIFEYGIDSIINNLDICILLIKYNTNLNYNNKISKNYKPNNKSHRNINYKLTTTYYNFHPLINIVYGLMEFINTDSIKNKLLEIFDLLLEKGIDININVPIIVRSNHKDFINGTPIDLACIFGNIGLIDFLISKGATPTKKTLIIASKKHNKEIFNLLIDKYYFIKFNNLDNHLLDYFIKI